MDHLKNTLISIVSHGNAYDICLILTHMQELGIINKYPILITINKDEDIQILERFNKKNITFIVNDKPQGFSLNHNNAFKTTNPDYFFVINPDISISTDVFSECIEFLSRKRNGGVVSPTVMNVNGGLEDHARIDITLANLIRRRLHCDKKTCLKDDNSENVEWLAGMFLCIRGDVFRKLNGFDENFFLYCEDADICRRIRSIGYKNILLNEVKIIHNAQRESRKSLQYLKWHLKSMIYYFFKYNFLLKY